MAVTIEFEVSGRTYRVKPNRLLEWNITYIGLLRDVISLETDLITGDKIFVAWDQIDVLRRVKKKVAGDPSDDEAIGDTDS